MPKDLRFVNSIVADRQLLQALMACPEGGLPKWLGMAWRLAILTPTDRSQRWPEGLPGTLVCMVQLLSTLLPERLVDEGTRVGRDMKGDRLTN